MKLVPALGIVGVVALREAATTEMNQIIGLVRAALQARFDAAKKPGDGYTWFDIEAMFPDRAIVCKDGRYWQFGYTLDAGNNVVLQDPVEVVEEFKPVAMREAVNLEALQDADFLEAAGGSGKTWEVVVIRAGVSKNGFYYSDAVLREAAPLFDGVNVFAKSDDDHLDERKRPNINQIAGWISGARFVEGKGKDSGFIAGTLNWSGQSALRETVADAWARGKKNLVGLSIDAAGKVVKATGTLLREGAKAVAQSITKVLSVDLIVNPSAGGALVRLVEAADSKEQDPMRDLMLAAVKAKFPNLDVAGLTDDGLLTKYKEAIAAELPNGNGARQDGPQMTREEFQAELRMVEARAQARARINATKLPEPSKAALIKRFEGLARFTEADVDTEIKAERDYVVRIMEATGGDAGAVRLSEAGDIQVEDRSKMIAEMLDAFFDPSHKDHRATQSFKECYVEITGDRRVTGRVENCDRTRLRESIGAAFRESIDTSGFDVVLGAALRRTLLADYRRPNQYDVWRKIVNIVPVADFRTNERTRFGGYGDLPTVAEGSSYNSLSSPTDEKATYAVVKKGGTEDVTIEAIKNDDVGAIRAIPVKMSRAAKRTVAKLVLDLIRTNPTIYDSVAFFHASRGNLGAAALDATALAARRLAMLKQAEADSSDRLGIGPRYLIVPVDLEETAQNLFSRNTNNDKTFVNNMSLEVLPVWYWTDTNDWTIGADPMECPSIEVGFLDGNEEPEVYVQDNPSAGSLFSHDKITYKLRQIAGAQVVNYRGFDKSVL